MIIFGRIVFDLGHVSECALFGDVHVDFFFKEATISLSQIAS